MTIDKARKILNSQNIQSTDGQIKKIIFCFEKIIEVGFQKFESNYQKNTFDKIQVKET